MPDPHIGVLGASGLVGSFLLPLLAETGRRVTAFSRRETPRAEGKIQWQPLSADTRDTGDIPHWISLVPIWVLPEYGAWMAARGARRVVALSSTSVVVKKRSGDAYEQKVAGKLEIGEAYLRAWGAARKADWIVLRPTLIYGDGKDRNISEIMAMVDRLGFFPLMGRAKGKRQPVHAQDVAAACLSVLNSCLLNNRAYNLAGGETLAYREMVARVFDGLDRRPVLPVFPGWVFRLALMGLRVFPRYRHWSMAMVERMNQDLVFDCSEAARDFGYAPREKFQITRRRP